MTRLETPIKDILGTKYYTYQLRATKYNPSLNATITIICAVSNDYNAEQPSSVILYQNDVEIGPGTLQTSGTFIDHYTWTITCDTPGLQIFRVKDTSISVYVENELVDMVYPVGSIYMSVNSTSPSVLFGGTWTQLEDTFLLACGSTYASDGANVHTAQHGEATHTLTINEMPSHNHTRTTQPQSWAERDSSGNEIISPATGAAKKVTKSVNNTGGGQAHNNMPPYMAVYMWKRTA